MKILPTTELAALNTLGVEARASRVVCLEHVGELESTDFDPQRDLILGGGSNVILAADIPGTVFLVRMSGRSVKDETTGHVMVEAAAGENWHELVNWTLDQGYSGLENLALIPGLAGAAPMQNIGAYGVELSDRLESLTAWDWVKSKPVTFSRDECRFGYRDSRFKTVEPGRYLITGIRLKLDRQFHPELAYSGLAEALDRHGIVQPTAREVADLVTSIRQNKLPDPGVVGNVGSFFKNPVIKSASADQLRQQHPNLPMYTNNSTADVKLSAAWMIEACGWKGHRIDDAAVSDGHALVLVNHGQANGRQILELADLIRNSVNETFGIELEIEPRIVPAHRDAPF